MRFDHLLTAIATAALTATLAACSGGGGGLTTGSLFGSGQASSAAAAPPPPATPSDRALQAGAVAARAAKCGYNFDPAKLKSAYLAYEAQQGTTPELLQRVEREYEFSRLTVRNRIAKDEGYCTEEKTRVIKTDLTKQLAGDFAVAPVKVAKASGGGMFDSLAADTDGREVINPEYMRDKSAPKTKRISNDD